MPAILLLLALAAAPASPEAEGLAGTGMPALPTTIAGEDTCTWSQMYRAVQPSVVRIESAGGFGSGFLFGSRRFVATAHHVVDVIRALRVITSDGKELNAKVVASNRDQDIALLELDRELQGQPLEPMDAPPPPGTPVGVIGHPFFTGNAFVPTEMTGLLTWTLSIGHTSTTNDWLLQYDAPTNPGNSGGPLLTCDGRVAGVVSRKVMGADGIGWAVHVRHLVALSSEVGKQPEYRGRFRMSKSLGLRYHMQSETPSLLGLEFGVGSVFNDHTEVRAGIMVLASPFVTQPPDGVADTKWRVGLEGELRYRILLPFLLPSHLAIGIGVLGAVDHESERRFHIENPASCSGSCDPVIVAKDFGTSTKHLLLGPRLALVVKSFELAYWPMWEEAKLNAVIHQLSIGICF